MSLLGGSGIRKVAIACLSNTRKLVGELTKIPQVRRIFEGEYFHECIIRVPGSAKDLVKSLAKKGILAGLPVSDYPGNEGALLVCATEMVTDEAISRFAHAVSQWCKHK